MVDLNLGRQEHIHQGNLAGTPELPVQCGEIGSQSVWSLPRLAAGLPGLTQPLCPIVDVDGWSGRSGGGGAEVEIVRLEVASTLQGEDLFQRCIGLLLRSKRLVVRRDKAGTYRRVQHHVHGAEDLCGLVGHLAVDVIGNVGFAKRSALVAPCQAGRWRRWRADCRDGPVLPPWAGVCPTAPRDPRDLPESRRARGSPPAKRDQEADLGASSEAPLSAPIAAENPAEILLVFTIHGEIIPPYAASSTTSPRSRQGNIRRTSPPIFSRPRRSSKSE